jgi:ubiquinone/menaquinone biosynthesis C-methylase UbiE
MDGRRQRLCGVGSRSRSDTVMADQSSVASKRRLYRAFDDAVSHTDDLYQVYRDMYSGLPEIPVHARLEDRHSFDYCKQRKYFVLIAPYTKHQQILVEVNFADLKLTRRLLGGSVRADRMETFIDAACRLALHSVAKLQLGEIEPVAFLKNHFTFGDQEWYHHGIAFAARIRNPDPEGIVRDTIHSRAQLIPHDDTDVPFGLLHNAAVAQLVRRRLDETDFGDVPEFEVAENLKYKGRYKFHNLVVKPCFRWFGRGCFLFPYSVRQCDEKILSILRSGEHGKILDVACGENRAVVDLAKIPGVNLAVGNDVSWSQIQLMAERHDGEDMRNRESLVLFTNHDARRLPFGDQSFDFVLCKNVLHHMKDIDSVRRLIDEVVRVGKRALIVEIMDPKYESRWGRIRHRYWTGWLHDAGSHFLSREAFADLTKMPEKTEAFDMATVRGVYQFALFAAPPGAS